MTDLPLAGLLEALRATPDNQALRQLLADAALKNDDVETLRAAQALCGAGFPADDGQREAMLGLFIARELLDDVRATVTPTTCAPLLQATRDHLQRGQRKQAEALYAIVQRMNPALEDNAIANALSGKVVALHAGPRAAPSIANDDTDQDDVVQLLQPAGQRVVFADVGGLDAVKKEIRRRIITPFLKPSLFQRFKRNAGGGILLYGPPGCGKTLLARATAGECGARFYNVAVNDVLDMYIGESERKLHAIFEQARRTAPAVLFFDEIEAIGGKRQHARESTSAKLVSQFLTELDGFAQNNDGVLILGATNVPWAVDAAFRRPGRFDRVLFVPPPDAAARSTILQLLLHERPLATDVDIANITPKTSGFSGADLRNLVDTAADEAIEQSIDSGREQPLRQAHLLAALEQLRPTTLEWLTTARNHARYANQGGQYDAVLEFLDKH